MLHIKIAIDNIFSQLKRFLISVLLVAVSLVLIIVAVLAYEGSNYSYSSCDKLLTKGMEGTGVLNIETHESIEAFWDEASKQEEIFAITDMSVGGRENILGLYDIQKKNTEGIFAPDSGEELLGMPVLDDYISVLDIDIRGINLCDLELSKGTMPEDLDYSKSSDTNIIYYIYLGSAYASIPVGAEYKKEYIDATATYIVAGIMEEGQKWIDPGIDWSIDGGKLDYTVDCTYGIFIVGNLLQLSPRFILSANDGYTIEEALGTAHELADKHGIELHSMTMTELYEESNEVIVFLLSSLIEAFAIVIPAVILMLITMQIVSVRLELNTYGIMCSLGFSIKDINVMLIIKNVIMALVGLAIATPVVIRLADQWFDDKLSYVMDTIMLSVALPTAIIILPVVILITSLTSVVMLKRYTPVKLMGTRN